jgi:hypothetical protein
MGNSVSNPECPGHNPECPDSVSGVSERIPGVSGLLFSVCKTHLVRSLRTPCPEYSDIYPEYLGTALPTASFWERGYKYPHTPSLSLSLAHFRLEQLKSQREPSHSPFASLLSDFLWGLK